MKNSITIEGSEYISAKFAASITKYTSDYVGQLARAGKLPSTKVGKERYVRKSDFLSYALDQGKLRDGILYSEPQVREAVETALSYEHDNGSLIPNLTKRNVLEVESLDEIPHVETRHEKKVPARTFHISSFLKGALVPLVALLLVGSSITAFNALDKEANSNLASASSSGVTITSIANEIVQEGKYIIKKIEYFIFGTPEVAANNSEENPFADEVEESDEFVAPEFKETKDGKYMYVVLPIEE